MANRDPDFCLYTYFRSSCSARLRIALALKSISYSSKPVNLLKGEQRLAEYSDINPSHSVPSLQPLSGPDANADVLITQSIAALEYLEERYPDSAPLLPPTSSPADRAYVRSLVGVIACDLQPVTNLRILTRVDGLGGSKAEWAKELMGDGLAAYERLVAARAGRFSLGDAISLADVCLIPAVWGAMRFKVDMTAFPVVTRIFEEMSGLDAVKQAHWKNQLDTPEELRG